MRPGHRSWRRLQVALEEIDPDRRAGLGVVAPQLPAVELDRVEVLVGSALAAMRCARGAPSQSGNRRPSRAFPTCSAGAAYGLAAGAAGDRDAIADREPGWRQLPGDVCPGSAGTGASATAAAAPPQYERTGALALGEAGPAARGRGPSVALRRGARRALPARARPDRPPIARGWRATAGSSRRGTALREGAPSPTGTHPR